MVKAGTSLLRSLMRAGKKQQRTVTKVLGLLAAPSPKAKPKPRLSKKAAAAPKSRSSRPVAPAPAKPSARARPVTLKPATGKWLASHYPALPGPGALAVKRMSYWLYLPDRPVADGARGLPLLVMLHGCEQTATKFAEGTRMNQVAEQEGYAVLYPQQSLSSHPHRCWKWYDRATQQGGGDVRAIVGIVQKVLTQYRIDSSRIYICGISAGAAMANIVALNHPQLFAGLGVHSGPVFGAGHSMVGALGVMQRGAAGRTDQAITEVLERNASFPPMPTILIQGEADKVVRPVNQAQLVRQAMLLNRLPSNSPVEVTQQPGTTRTHSYQMSDIYRDRKLLLRVTQIAGLEHAWSGGDGRVSYHVSPGPNASKMMLNFFSQQRRVH